mgnify:CR=1 FL=1
MNWWHVLAGVAGIIGTLVSSSFSSWLVALAFLLLAVEGFTGKQ